MPAINPLPTPPSRNDPANFSDRADAFLAALPAYTNEANALLDDVHTSRDTVQGLRDEVMAAGLANAATNAATATTKAAEASASAAEAFGYLQAYRATSYGALASDPVVDPNGNPPTVGDEYFSTTMNLLKRFNGVTWQASDIATANLAAPGGAALVGYGAGTVEDALDALEGGSSSAIDIRTYGAVLDGVTNDAAALLAANAAAAAAKLPLLIPGVANIGAATTITAPLVDGLHQMFSVTSSVIINNGLPVRPEWFGNGENTLRYAEAALPSTGGTILLEEKTYQRNNYAYGTSGTGTYISKPNVKLQGRKMPRLSNDMRKLEGGTIIQGMVLAYADNFQIENLGVDSGIDVVNAHYSGVAQEGLLLTYPDEASKAASTLKRQARLHNVIGLCANPTAAVHGVIVGEGYDQVSCTGQVVGAYGVHGVVIKCSTVTADTFVAYCNGGEGVIIKSDAQSTAASDRIQIGRIHTTAHGPVGLSPHVSALNTQQYSLLIQPEGNNVDVVEIGQIYASGAIYGISQIFGGSYASSSVKIGSAIIDQYGVTGTKVGLQLNGTGTGQAVVRWNIEHLEVRNSTIGAQFSFDNTSDMDRHVHIGHLHVAQSEFAVDIGSKSKVTIGVVSTDACTSGVYHITGTPKISVGQLMLDAGTTTVYSSASGGLAPALTNGWTQRAGNDPFGVDLLGGRVNLRGLVKPGSTTTLCVLPAWARPVTNKRFLAQGSNVTALQAVSVVVGDNGIVLVNEIGGGFANCSDWLSLSGISWDQQA